MVAVLPPASEWDHIAKVTGDKTWSFDHIQPLWERLERCAYLPPGTPGHGFKGYLETNVPDESTVTPAQPVITEAVKIQGPSNAKLRDINDLSKPRGTGVYHSCLNMTKDGRRSFARNYIVATALARDAKGNKKYNLTVSTNSLATRIMFDHGKRRRGRHAKTMPNATAVEFLVRATVMILSTLVAIILSTWKLTFNSRVRVSTRPILDSTPSSLGSRELHTPRKRSSSQVVLSTLHSC